MSAPRPVPHLPRASMPAEYEQTTIEQAFQAVEEELVDKFSRKGDVVLEPGKKLVLSSETTNTPFAIGLNANDYLVLINYATGDESAIVVEMASVAGLVQEITDVRSEFATADGVISASVSVNAAAIADIDGQLGAYYAIAVDGGGTGSFLRMSDNAAYGSAIALSADEITLDADAINFGAQTLFDLSSETFISTTGTIKARYGSAFGTDSDVVLWHGPVSVDNGDETPTNAYLALAEDGLYINGAAAGWGANAAEAAASNAQVALGQNLLINTDFARGLIGWRTGTQVPGTIPVTRYLATSGTWGSSRPTLVAEAPGHTPSSGQIIDLYAQGPNYWGELAAAEDYGLVVTPGERLYVSWLIGLYQGFSSAGVYVRFHDASNSLVTGGEVLVGSGGNIGGGAGGDPDNFDRVGGFVTVPAGAKWAGVYVRGVCNGSSNPIMVGQQPFMAKVSASQTEAPPYTAGPSDKRGDPTEDNTAAAIAGQGLLALGNFYEQATDPGSVANGSLWAQTGSGDLYIRVSSTWKRIANIGGDLSISLSPSSYSGPNPSGTITGTASGGSGVYSTYAWTKVSGTTMTLSAPSSASTTFNSGGVSKSATYRLTVTDSLGATAYQDISIIIIVV